MKNEIVLLFFKTIGEEFSSDKLPRKRKVNFFLKLQNKMKIKYYEKE